MDAEHINAAFERIKSRVKIDEHGCWIWTGAHTAGFYGSVRVGARVLATHRVAYMAEKGEIPRGKVVRHVCDVAACCNPDHLCIGDHEDNNRDIVERGGHKRTRVLSADERQQIIAMRRGGATKRAIAQALRCNWYAISSVLDDFESTRGKVGRPKGSRNSRAKIPEESKAEMRRLYASGKFTQQQLAERFGCDQTYVSIIVRSAP